MYLTDTQPNMTAEAIAEVVRLSAHRVKIIHTNFRKYGMDSIKDKRGGRYREYMSVEEKIVIDEIKTARREAYEPGMPDIPFDEVVIMFQDEARFGRINSPNSCWVKGRPKKSTGKDEPFYCFCSFRTNRREL